MSLVFKACLVLFCCVCFRVCEVGPKLPIRACCLKLTFFLFFHVFVGLPCIIFTFYWRFFPSAHVWGFNVTSPAGVPHQGGTGRAGAAHVHGHQLGR